MKRLRRFVSPVLFLVVVLATAPLNIAPAGAEDSTPQSLGLAWGQQLNDAGFDEDLTAVDAADGVVWSAGSAEDENNGETDALIRRTAPDGTQLSRLDEGDPSATDAADGIDAGSWGAVVAGTTSGVFPGTDSTSPNYGEHGWVQLLDASGAVVWTTGFDNDRAIEVSGVTVDAGRVFVVGTYRTEQVPQFEIDSFDLATGAPLASRTIGTTGEQSLRSVTTADGNVIIGGATTASLEPGAAHSPPDDYRYDAVIAALDPSDLSTVWLRQFGTAGDDTVATLSARDGVVYWGGSAGNLDDADEFSPSIGAVGAVSAADGAPLWQDNLGPQSAFVRSITTTSRGVVLGGQISPDNSTTEMYLEGRAFDGTPQWHLVLGGSGYDIAQGVVSPADRVFFVGTTYEGIFGPKKGIGQEAVMAALDAQDVLQPSLLVDGAAATRSGPARAARARTGAPSEHPVRIVVRRGRATRSTVLLRNSGIVTDELSLSGCSAIPHLGLHLTHQHQDVTRAVASGRYVTPQLPPSRAITFTWHLAAATAAHGVHSCAFSATSVHDSKAVDRVPVRIVVKR